MESIGRREAVGFSAFMLSAAASLGEAQAQSPATMLQGKSCVILGKDDALARAVTDQLKSAGATTVRLYPDQASEEAYQAALEGPNKPANVDVIVNLAFPESNGAIGTVKLADFRKVLEDNYVRTYLAMKYGTRVLRAAGGGAFITVTSSAGKRGAPKAVAACAVSNGIMQMTRCAALECASKDDNVRVNTLLADKVSGEKSEAIGSAVAFLAADASVYFTGMLVPLDDGDVF